MESAMTAADLRTENTTAAPNTSLAELKARYKNVREPILVALHLLLEDANISLEDAKLRAKELGVRVTAASVAGARRLLERMGTAPAAPAAVPAASTASTAPTMPSRRARGAEATPDDEALIRAVVGKVRAQGDAQAEKLRASIRRAIELLTTALA
jgi:hypothetical protein